MWCRGVQSALWLRSAGDVPCAVDSVQWSSPLEVLQYPHHKLRAPNALLTASAFGPELQRLAAEMFDIMYRCTRTTADIPLHCRHQSNREIQ